MTQTLEDAGKFGKEFMDTGLKSLASLSKGWQSIAVEATEYSKKSFETGSAAIEKLVVGEIAGKGDRDPDRLRQAGL